MVATLLSCFCLRQTYWTNKPNSQSQSLGIFFLLNFSKKINVTNTKQLAGKDYYSNNELELRFHSFPCNLGRQMTGVLRCQCTLRYTHGQSIVYGYLLSCLTSHHCQDCPPKPIKGKKGKTERALAGGPNTRGKFGKMVLTITIVFNFSRIYLIKKHVFGIQKDLGLFHFQVQKCKANLIFK